MREKAKEEKNNDCIQEQVKQSNQNTLSPEVLLNPSYSYKSDFWSLGINIYYMCFKEYPFNGLNVNLINQDIKNNINNLKSTNNPLLDDLIKKMLKINIKDRINWDNYFNHPFFQENMEIPQFNFNCEKHTIKPFRYYCNNFQKNICELCKKVEEKKHHFCIEISDIGLSSKEEKEIEHLMKKIEENIEKMNQLKHIIEYYLKYIKKVKGNIKKIILKNHFKECL